MVESRRRGIQPLSSPKGPPKGDGKGVGRGDADPFVGTGTRMQGACVREAAGWAKQGDLARRGPEPFLQVCVAAEMFVEQMGERVTEGF